MRIQIFIIEWVTEDLLSKILKHPKLAKQFMDPRFSQAIEKFQKNPQEVMEMCKTNAELKEFIQEFCALMGDHFTGLADQKDKVRFLHYLRTFTAHTVSLFQARVLMQLYHCDDVFKFKEF